MLKTTSLSQLPCMFPEHSIVGCCTPYEISGTMSPLTNKPSGMWTNNLTANNSLCFYSSNNHVYKSRMLSDDSVLADDYTHYR